MPRRLILLSLAAFMLSLPVVADEPVFRLRVGQFTPHGESAFWKNKAEVSDGSARDLEDVSYGLDWNYPIAQGLGVLVAGSLFDGKTDQTTLEDSSFTGTHRTELRIASLSVLLTYMAPSEWRVRPWVGLGGGAYQWKLKEVGDVYDGDDLVDGKLSEDDLDFGLTAAVGVDFWIQENWGLSLDYRQYWLDADPSKDFEDRGKIDLSGKEVTLGFIWMF